VSCPSATACTAAGILVSNSITGETLAESRNGTAWAAQPTPNPSGAEDSSLQGVSCPSASGCTAVGDFVPSSTSSPRVTLAERWNGTAWAIEPTPNPAGSTASELNGVSCTSATSCTAVGYYSASSGLAETLAERWNGTAWTVQATPNPSSAQGNYSALYGVSCASATSCTAAGDYDNSATGITVTLAEHWNGTAWALQATPNPHAAETSRLEGVSCTSASACTAAGDYSGFTIGFYVTLAERYS